jgi:hypothetical protein
MAIKALWRFNKQDLVRIRSGEKREGGLKHDSQIAPASV